MRSRAQTSLSLGNEEHDSNDLGLSRSELKLIVVCRRRIQALTESSGTETKERPHGPYVVLRLYWTFSFEINQFVEVVYEEF
jgi:hypothetical protein